jgi:hypothetical protein
MDIPEQYENGKDYQPQGIEHLTALIEGLTQKIDSFIDMYKNAVPMKVMLINFGMIFGLFFGIEAVKFFFNFLSKYFHI